MKKNETVKKPAGRYYGGKWRLAPWIIPFIPEDHDLYGEAYGGLASVLLRKERSPMEVWNDLNLEVENYLEMLRDHKRKLINAINLTPYSLTQWHTAVSFDAEALLLRQPSLKKRIEAARLFYVRSMLSISGQTASGNPGFRRQYILNKNKKGSAMTPAAVSFSRSDHLMAVAERLQGVVFERLNAVEFLQRYDSERTVQYVDPPYLPNSRQRANGYKFEMTKHDHELLAGCLHESKSMVVLSHYDCAEYDRWYTDRGWQKHLTEARINGSGTAVEAVYLNPAAVSAREAEFEAAVRLKEYELEKAREKEREKYPLLYFNQMG